VGSLQSVWPMGCTTLCCAVAICGISGVMGYDGSGDGS
jgi:hypothetical protein